MASTQNALICAGLATFLWTCIGLPLSSRLMPSFLAWPVASILGWAVHSAVVLPIFFILGLTKTSLIVVITLTSIGAVAAVLTGQSWGFGAVADTRRIPIWAVGGATILASAIMAMILPHTTADGITLTDVIFDHSKVAMIDDIARLGLPAGNPFFGESDGLDRLSYYYLWHFSAAELVVLTGLSGWEADAGMTWFTAFSSLTLMMGLAVWLSGRRSAAGWVLILASVFSIRPILSLIFGRDLTYAVTGWPSGFGAWMFQTSWAPQHAASASCAVLSVVLLVELARRPNLLAVIVLSLVVTAAFESSTWIGGVTFPIAAVAIASVILCQIDRRIRLLFILSAAGAAALSIAIAFPFIHDQFYASALRAHTIPIGILPYEVLGDETPEGLRTLLNVPAYWSVFLFTEFAAFYPTGFIMMVWLTKDRSLSRVQKMCVTAFGTFALMSLGVGSVLISRLGENNDLAWRGVLPGVIILIILSAAGLSKYMRSMRLICACAVLIPIALGCFEGIRNIQYNFSDRSHHPSRLFEKSAAMWKAVREHSKPDDRIANNAVFLTDMTNWPINISWALMANRRSCYAGNGYWPFAPHTKLSRDDIDAQFDRIFSGNPKANDLEQLAELYHCSVVVLTPQDGAWNRDPFSSSSFYRLVGSEADAWRIYSLRTSHVPP